MLQSQTESRARRALKRVVIEGLALGIALFASVIIAMILTGGLLPELAAVFFFLALGVSFMLSRAWLSQVIGR
jgi:hypothetical protein